MSQKFLKSADVDLKEFMGRCLTLLGEINSRQQHLQEFLEDSFHVPQEYRKGGSHKQDDVYDDEDDDYDISGESDE